MKVRSVYSKYVNIEDHYINILSADTIYSYFQDKFPTVHYNIFIGDNGSGKNSALIVYSHSCIHKAAESHLHPQGRRLLRQILTECSNRNQIIIIPHSAELFDFEDLDKITLVHQKGSESEPCRVKSEILLDPYWKKTLTKLRRTEYKELFFAKKVLLVEGETEFGAIPIFSSNLDYNFDKNSVSIIPVHGNYFVVFAKILQDLQIPHLIVCVQFS